MYIEIAVNNKKLCNWWENKALGHEITLQAHEIMHSMTMEAKI
jgi:hypothetical protein